MRTEDHPNNAPGVPMIYPPWFENFQVKYFNPMIKPLARSRVCDHQASRPQVR